MVLLYITSLWVLSILSNKHMQVCVCGKDEEYAYEEAILIGSDGFT